jgi:hypothetical protein
MTENKTENNIDKEEDFCLDQEKSTLLENFDEETKVVHELLENSLITKLLAQLEKENPELYDDALNYLDEDNIANLSMLEDYEQLEFLKKIINLNKKIEQEEELSKKKSNAYSEEVSNCKELQEELEYINNLLNKHEEKLKHTLEENEKLLIENSKLSEKLLVNKKSYISLKEENDKLSEDSSNNEEQLILENKLKKKEEDLELVKGILKKIEIVTPKKDNFLIKSIDFIFWNIITLTLMTLIFIKI